jgi:polyisoprenoid-binding protein YceI
MTLKASMILALSLAAMLADVAVPAAKLPSLAEVAGRYAIAPSSNIAFTVGQVGRGGIKGRFGRFSGTFDLKSGNLAGSVVSFELRPESVSTGQNRMDEFLRSGAVFDTDRFDRISFRSSRIEKTGADTARVTGMLTAKGKTLPESFDVRLLGWTGRSISFSVRGRIFRSRYGMDVGTPMYSNVVQFDMTIEGQRR